MVALAPEGFGSSPCFLVAALPRPLRGPAAFFFGEVDSVTELLRFFVLGFC